METTRMEIQWLESCNWCARTNNIVATYRHNQFWQNVFGSIASTVKRKNKPPTSSRCSRSSESWESNLHSRVYKQLASHILPRWHQSSNHETPRLGYEISWPVFRRRILNNNQQISKNNATSPAQTLPNIYLHGGGIYLHHGCCASLLDASMLRHRQFCSDRDMSHLFVGIRTSRQPLQAPIWYLWHKGTYNTYDGVTVTLSITNE
jgi:hypothetical protein